MTGRSATAPAIGMVKALAIVRAASPTLTWTITGGWLTTTDGVKARPRPGSMWEVEAAGEVKTASQHSLPHAITNALVDVEKRNKLATNVDDLRARFRRA